MCCRIKHLALDRVRVSTAVGDFVGQSWVCDLMRLLLQHE